MRHAAPRTAAVGGRPVRPVLFFHANTSKHGFFIGFHPSYRSIHAPYRSGVWLMDLRGPFRSRFLRNGSGRYAVSARRLAVVRGRSHRGTARNAHRRASARCRPLCRGRCRRLLQLFGRPVFRSQTFRRPQLPNLQTELSGQDVRILSEIRRQNRRPRPLRSHRAHVRSVCRRNGHSTCSAAARGSSCSAMPAIFSEICISCSGISNCWS